MKKIDCLRCKNKMQFLGREQLQQGKPGWFLGDLPNLLAGALEVELYCCPSCGHLEFFRPEEIFEYRIPQVECPYCGMLHDMDDPKCPFCKRRLQD